MVTKETIGRSSLPSSRPPFLPLLSLLPSFLSLFFLLLRCLLFRCSFCLISGVGSRCRGLNPQPVCAKYLSNQWASPTASRHQRNSESLSLQHHQQGQGSCPSYILGWHYLSVSDHIDCPVLLELNATYFTGWDAQRLWIATRVCFLSPNRLFSCLLVCFFTSAQYLIAEVLGSSGPLYILFLGDLIQFDHFKSFCTILHLKPWWNPGRTWLNPSDLTYFPCAS